MPTLYETTGPHIHSRDSIAATMWTLVLALLPATAAALWFYGAYALYLVLSCAIASVLFEAPFVPGPITRRRPLGDGSSFVGGMILGLSLPPTSAWWVPLVGAALLVIVGKQVFGGLGNNIFNPALVARAILLLAWPRQLTGWVTPFDAVTTATPLAGLETGYLPMLLGTVPGSIGETSVAALLLGAVFLIATRTITWRVPVSVLGGAAVGALIFGVDPLFTILAGSLMYGAIFMATDMVTSPTGRTAHLVYGAGCGLLTVFIREYTVYPEGITFAFLIMNGLAYLIDRIGADPFFGQVEKRKRRISRIAITAGLGVIIVGVVGAGIIARTSVSERFADAALSRRVRGSFSDSDRIVEADSFDPAVQVFRVYNARILLGLYARTETDGYGGPIAVHAALDPTGRVNEVRIGEHAESPTVGARVSTREFLSQFIGYRSENRSAIDDEVEAISGATVSSRAVTRAVVQILGARDEAAHATDTSVPIPTVPDDLYTGVGTGYNGRISLSVQVQGGRVVEIEAVSHSETPGVGGRALEELIERTIEAQRLGLDAVSGATETSRGFTEAMEHALVNR